MWASFEQAAMKMTFALRSIKPGFENRCRIGARERFVP
jgi:hypothetical protein